MADIEGSVSGNSDALSADSLSPAQIDDLKEKERLNRDRGAEEFTGGSYYGKPPFQLRAEHRTYLRLLAPRPGETFLDAGAGLGRLALQVAPRVERLVCVDLSSRSLDIVKSDAQSRGIHNIATVQGDVCKLPAELGVFDGAYSVEVIEHIPSHHERLAAARGLRERLKRGGRCLVSVHGWNFRVSRRHMVKEGFWGTGERRLYHYYFTPQELAALLQEAGFQAIRLRGLLMLPGRITRFLPTSLAVVETWCSMMPGTEGSGMLIVATAGRPTAA